MTSVITDSMTAGLIVKKWKLLSIDRTSEKTDGKEKKSHRTGRSVKMKVLCVATTENYTQTREGLRREPSHGA